MAPMIQSEDQSEPDSDSPKQPAQCQNTKKTSAASLRWNPDEWMALVMSGWSISAVIAVRFIQ